MGKKKDKKKKEWGFFQEFKTFIKRGNIVDLAVGVIIGTSFKEIVNRLTDNIIMPFITYIIGDHTMDGLKTVLRDPVLDDLGNIVVAELAIDWGLFIQGIIDFLIIAFVMFTAIFILNRIHKHMIKTKERIANELLKKQKDDQELTEEVIVEPEVIEEVKVDENILLLTEIRDLLKQQNINTVDNSKEKLL